MLSLAAAVKFMFVATTLLFAVTARKRALFAFVITIPVRLTTFEAISHPFLLSELLLIILISQQMIVWSQTGYIDFPNRQALGWFGIFGVVMLLSLVYLVVDPAGTVVRPYNVLGKYNFLHLSPVTLQSNNVSQLFLRLFYLISVFVLTVNLTDLARIRFVLRFTVFGALFVGLIGLLYQFSVFLNVEIIWRAFQSLPALGIRPLASANYMPHSFPRMYSIVGEPGFASDYLLYAFTVTATLTFTVHEDAVFTRNKKAVLVPTTLVLLILSTGTTGYFGVILFLTVISLLTPLSKGLDSRRLFAGVGMLVTAGILTLIPLLIQNRQFYPVRKIVRVFRLLFGLENATVPIRIQWLLNAFEPLQHRPFLGVGIGSHNTPTQLASLLVEVGLLGTISFIMAHVFVFQQTFVAGHNSRKVISPIALALSIAGAVLFITNLIGKSFSALLFPWVCLSVALPLALVALCERDSIETE